MSGSAPGTIQHGRNPRSAHLPQTDLRSAVQRDTNLSEALLTVAHLVKANRKASPCLGSDLEGAHLTGASLEAWNEDVFATLLPSARVNKGAVEQTFFNDQARLTIEAFPNQRPAEDQPSLREVHQELKASIEADSFLSEPTPAQALGEIQELATAAAMTRALGATWA